MMNRILLFGLLVLLLCAGQTKAQVVTTDPAFPRADQPVTIRVDVTGTSLDKLDWNNTTNPVWIWTWIAEGCTSNCDAPTNVNPATGGQDAAKATRVSTNPDVYSITFTPTTFFNRPASQLKRIGLKLKTRSWSDNKQTDQDRFVTFYEGFALVLSTPSSFPIFVDANAQIPIVAQTPSNATFTVKVNGTQVTSVSGVSSLNYQLTALSSGTNAVVISATDGTETKEVSFTYTVRTPTVSAKRPAGIIDGINYSATDQTTVTLGLWAPGKSSVYVLGDFNDWQVDSDYQMKRDGEHFWLKIDGLVAGQEYAYQYLIDERVRVADPYADKILDPDDQFISASVYPGLKPYPEKARVSQSWLSRAAVFQTGQQPYQWQVQNFQKPANEKLIIYELLIRDLFGSDNRTYQALIDTLSYFKRLGVNAVQLMPIMEYNGNESWGYNPTFMFAPDKAHGPKNKLKEFVDKCHQNGIAVILDIAMNHQDIQNPYILMDFDFQANALPATNKWFNPVARHPYNVFFDMNHESSYTKAYLDTVNYYWLKEYKIDGYRFDLSKGFTQNDRCQGSTSDEGCFFQRDPSRIAILKRMSDRIRASFPDAILILEHFAENSEEIELSDHGFLLWGNLNHAYNQNTKGFASGSDISSGYFKSRNWTKPNLVTYMESHDEERLMVRNLTEGAILDNYSTRDLATALERMRAAGAIFYTIPGPKMLWQFGEFGYDQSINRCTNGSVTPNCRLDPKPVLWSYLQEPQRKKLFDQTAEILRLRSLYRVFNTGEVSFSGTNSVIKQVTLRNTPYTTAPQNADQMNVHIVTNFDVVQRDIDVTFPHTGKWFELFNDGAELQVNGTVTRMTLPAGRYKIFTDVKVTSNFREDPYNIVVSVEESVERYSGIFPVPADNVVEVDVNGRAGRILQVLDVNGRAIEVSHLGENKYDVSGLRPGMYLVKIADGRLVRTAKLIKK